MHAGGHPEHRVFHRLLRGGVWIRHLPEPRFVRARGVFAATPRQGIGHLVDGIRRDRGKLRLPAAQQLLARDGHLAVPQRKAGLGRHAAPRISGEAESMIPIRVSHSGIQWQQAQRRKRLPRGGQQCIDPLQG